MAQAVLKAGGSDLKFNGGGSRRVTVADRQDFRRARRANRKRLGAFSGLANQRIRAARAALPGGDVIRRRNLRRRSAMTGVPIKVLEAQDKEAQGEGTVLQMVLNIMSSSWGQGFLVMPFALSGSGWAALGVVTVVLLLSAFINLLVCEAQLPGEISFMHICERGWGKRGFAAVTGMFYLVEILGATFATLTEARMLQGLADGSGLTKAYCCLITGTFHILVSLFPLNIMALVSAGGVFAMLTIMVFIVVWAFDPASAIGVLFPENSNSSSIIDNTTTALAMTNNITAAATTLPQLDNVVDPVQPVYTIFEPAQVSPSKLS